LIKYLSYIFIFFSQEDVGAKEVTREYFLYRLKKDNKQKIEDKWVIINE
jgi:hypothetical protein